MKRHYLFIFMMGMIALIFGVNSAQAFDPTGTWKFTQSDSSVSGVCPMGGNGTGTMTITDAGGGKYALKYLSGMVCNPASVCVLSGTCHSSKCVFQTTVPVDDEGGKVINTANFTFDAGHAVGSGSSVYRHPGMQCSWTFLLMLTK